MNNLPEAATIFIVFAVLLIGLILHSERQQRLDRVDSPESNIMQMRHEVRLVCYLLMYIGLLLAAMFAFMIYKLL